MLVLSVALKLVGVAFLCIAGLGVIRLSDPFQRMHAATKAGTLGAGLVILGTVTAHGATDATIVGVLTIIFLLLTVPVAGHLLGRASYVSGARLSLRGDDALEGILERSSRPLDERLGWLPVDEDGRETSIAARSELQPKMPATEPRRPAAILSLPKLETVRFALVHDNVQAVATRACAIASHADAALSAHVIIDMGAIENAQDPGSARRLIREKASAAIHSFRNCTADLKLDIALDYDEGDPEALLACADRGEALLVLPCEGWFHHGVEERLNLTSWEPDGLLRLPGVHKGPVLFISKVVFDDAPATIVLRDRGEHHLPALLEWALTAELWAASHITHVVSRAPADPGAIESIAKSFGCTYELRAVGTDDCAIPEDIGNPRAVIMGQSPRPLRTNWFGSHWHRRISPAMKGDVLMMDADR
jgi:monovalent cation/proton antiporter MnhG/PhaG subunit